jgi:hypothetical protein
MKIFKTKWEKMVLKLLKSSFYGVTLYNLSKGDPYEEIIKKLIYDSGITNDDYYNVFCYTVSKDKKKEAMLMNNFKGSELYFNIKNNIYSSDAVQLIINKIKPEFFDRIKNGDSFCLGDGHLIKPYIANFIVVKPE